MTELDSTQDGGPIHGGRDTQPRRLQSAKDRAASYRDGQQDSEQKETPHPVRPMDEWRDIVSQRIDDAMRQGLFDNLAGRGKPLDLRRDPFVPEDQQMAVTLLRNNGLAPEWILERKEVLAAIDNLRSEMRRAADDMRQAMHAAPDDACRARLRDAWAARITDWQTRIAQINRRVLVQNLKQPVRHLEILTLRLPDELARAGLGDMGQ